MNFLRQGCQKLLPETVVHAFIASRLDYCNALLYGVSDRLMCRLQSVQNAAARLVTGARWCDHITPILRQLHWLPVRQRVLFKITVLVFLTAWDILDVQIWASYVKTVKSYYLTYRQSVIQNWLKL